MTKDASQLFMRYDQNNEKAMNMDILILISLPVAAYILVNFIGAIIEGKIWPDKNDDGSTGAAGILILLIFVPLIMIIFDISKEYYFQTLIIVVAIGLLLKKISKK
jgi:uncharacterized membrane protein YoaK (UPF0700 family)